MFPSDYDDDDSPFSPAGNLEDDSLLDEVLMEAYDDNDKGAEEDAKTDTYEDMDIEDSGEVDDVDEDEELPLDEAGR